MSIKATLSKDQLLTQFESADFVLKTQVQVSKDFNQFSIDFTEKFNSTALSLEDILLIIEQKLAELLQFGEQTLLNYLYQVDIPEKQFVLLLNDNLFLPKMSEIILKREAYKVYLRSKY
ncbi:MAG: hypothetical protein KC454_03540 [Flavobacteriales bacterium]|nr:hypothetical protein [Flavobacteriales bacterium]